MGNGNAKQSGPEGKWKLASNHHRTLICRFCGGKSCKREDWTKQKEVSAVRGLHSTWVTTDLLAMQRPSSRLIREFDIIRQFKEQRISAIFNLQANGEHPHCGDGIDEGGFSYQPEEFMNQGIFYYNYGFTDMAVPSMDKMLFIIQSISFHVHTKGEKVSVHCHAGYGRTGIVMGCWLIYSNGMDCKEAIDTVRSRRPGCIQTKTQQQFCYKFAAYLTQLRRVYELTAVGSTEQSEDAINLEMCLARQNAYLHGAEQKTLARIAKVAYVLCGEISDRFYDSPEETKRKKKRKKKSDVAANALETFIGVGAEWGAEQEKQVRNIKLRINQDDWFSIKQLDAKYLSQLLLDWLETLTEPVLPGLAFALHWKEKDDVVIPTAEMYPNDYVVDEVNLETINVLCRFLQELKTSETPRESLELLYMRFAFALMHPQLQLPSTPPFRSKLFQLDSEVRKAVSQFEPHFNKAAPSPADEEGLQWEALSMKVKQDPYTVLPFGALRKLGRYLECFVEHWDGFCQEEEARKASTRVGPLRSVRSSVIEEEEDEGDSEDVENQSEDDTKQREAAAATALAKKEAEEAEKANKISSMKLRKRPMAMDSDFEDNVAKRIVQLFAMMTATQQALLTQSLLKTYGHNQPGRNKAPNLTTALERSVD